MFIVDPTGIPESLNFSVNSISQITVSWGELPCHDQNGEITGYIVEYHALMHTRTHAHAEAVFVPGANSTRLEVDGLLPSTNYSFSVKAAGATESINGTASTNSPDGTYLLGVGLGLGVGRARARARAARDYSARGWD